MKLRMEESDTVFEIDEIEPYPRTIADSILRMLSVAEAANPAIIKHEVLLELAYVQRAIDRQNLNRDLKDCRVVPASQAQDPFEDLRPVPPANIAPPTSPTKGTQADEDGF